ncbi:hypothetical protein GPECTOR_55g297 [Gonium pectorale]|uniref:RING-type domain-containing protein n=1 Tax=Gonium pectorale TaxID=33097 RepID=A0A150G6D8_GONPE|nr:hypothetical protein GPECTOR_55g297 [Gonium pectorale]|eukprot:KXZ45391.1 hypothetical protein GPECTOR_55g297 [Gonium pectorale]
MGCSASSLAVAELNKSLKHGDDSRLLLGKLEDQPWLLSTATSVLVSTAGTPLHTACERKHVEAVKNIFLFLSCAPLDTVREALQPYCRRAGLLLPSSVAEGAQMAVDMVNCKGQTPLMISCAAGSPELVKVLLAQGADPWARDRCGARTPLHYACMAGSAACIAALLEHLPLRHTERQGARYVDARSQCGLSALHYAVFFEHTGAVKELLRHNPALNAATTCDSYDVYVTCHPASTPLHFAAVRGSLTLARLLLEHYAAHLPPWEAPRSQDPRMRYNAGRQLPWQVAASHHPAARELVALLHPGQPLDVALGFATEGDQAGGASRHRVGPPPLAALAAVALRDKLLADLERCRKAAAPEAPAADSADMDTPLLGGSPQRAGGGGGNLLRASRRATSRTLSRTASAATQYMEGAEEDGLCGLCFAAREAVAPAGCGHAVCGSCAEALACGLVGASRPHPLACPFCRGQVRAFVPLAPPPAASWATAKGAPIGSAALSVRSPSSSMAAVTVAEAAVLTASRSGARIPRVIPA